MWVFSFGVFGALGALRGLAAQGWALGLSGSGAGALGAQGLWGGFGVYGLGLGRRRGLGFKGGGLGRLVFRCKVRGSRLSFVQTLVLMGLGASELRVGLGA